MHLAYRVEASLADVEIPNRLDTAGLDWQFRSGAYTGAQLLGHRRQLSCTLILPIHPGRCSGNLRRTITAVVTTELSPEESHAAWTKFKFDHGWTLGPVKDQAKKEHPLLLPYDQLPVSQQIKDHLFVAIVNTFR